MCGRGFGRGQGVPTRLSKAEEALREFRTLKPFMMERLRFLEETRRAGEFPEQVEHLDLFLKILNKSDSEVHRRFSPSSLRIYVEEVKTIRNEYPTPPNWIPIPSIQVADLTGSNDEREPGSVPAPIPSTSGTENRLETASSPAEATGTCPTTYNNHAPAGESSATSAFNDFPSPAAPHQNQPNSVCIALSKEEEVLKEFRDLKPFIMMRLQFICQTGRESENKSQVDRLKEILQLLDESDFYLTSNYYVFELVNIIQEIEYINLIHSHEIPEGWTPKETPISATRSSDTSTQVNYARPVPAPSELLPIVTSNSGERSSTNALARAIGDFTELAVDVPPPLTSSTSRSSSLQLPVRTSTPPNAMTEAAKSSTPPVVPTCSTTTTSSLHQPRHQHHYKGSRISRLIPRPRLLESIERPTLSDLPLTTTSNSGDSSSSDIPLSAMVDFTPPAIDAAAEEHDHLGNGTPSSSTVPMNTDCEMERQDGIMNLETSGGKNAGKDPMIFPRQEELPMNAAETFEVPQPPLIEGSSTCSGTNVKDMRANSHSNDDVQKAKGSRKKRQNISADHHQMQLRKRTAAVNAPGSKDSNINLIKQKQKDDAQAKSRADYEKGLKTFTPKMRGGRCVIGPNTTINNLALGKVKIESDYVAPKIKIEIPEVMK